MLEGVVACGQLDGRSSRTIALMPLAHVSEETLHKILVIWRQALLVTDINRQGRNKDKHRRPPGKPISPQTIKSLRIRRELTALARMPASCPLVARYAS